MVASHSNLTESFQRAALARSDFSASEKYQQEMQHLEAERAEAERKREQLVLQALFTGVIATPHIEQRVGEYLTEGEPPGGASVCDVGGLQCMRGRAGYREGLSRIHDLPSRYST